MKTYLEMLKHPPEEAKGWTRWWWYGCNVERAEIERELNFMKEAGLGGAEIQILYPLAADDPEHGFYNIPYFSPEFFEILEFTVETAKRLGLEIDYTLGSSWPYGGSFVPAEMAAQSVYAYQIDVSGPCPDYCYDFTTRIAGEIVGLVMGRMKHARMEERTVVDLLPLLQDKLLYGWPWGKMLEHVEIPEGDWKIVAFVSSHYRQQLAIPSRDAGGYVIDHCRKDVSDFFFRQAGKPLVDRLGRGSIRCFFCDSIELDGNNWTAILPAEFRRRRGYDLTPYLYALTGEVGEIADRVRYDYYRTMSELTLENFFENMTAWCHENGALSRIQAHGTWADILKAYAAADIPEGETFGPADKLEVNSIQRRFASSAAHLYGKSLVSNESFTWLGVPRFLETLEQVKAAADAIFLDGMNRIVNHGYAYSPPQAGKPGWPFYASSQLNHVNPNWDCYPELGRYIQRVSALLSQGRHHCEVGIYLPQADIWSENPMGDLHMAMKLQERLGWGVPDRINQAGYYFDYLNDEALNSLGSFGDGLTVQGNTYRVILLIGCMRLPEETAASLERFVVSGGLLLAAESVPCRSCGMKEWKKRDHAVQERMERLFPQERGVWKPFGRGFCAVAPDHGEKLLALLREKSRPDVEIHSGGNSVGFIHRTLPEGELYFLANISETRRTVEADFSAAPGGYCIYDALTARPVPGKYSLRDGEQATLTFTLESFGSAFVFFGEGLPEPVEENADVMEESPEKAKTEEIYPIPGSWKLVVPEVGFARELAEPVFWQTFPELAFFSGQGIYSCRFVLPALCGRRAYLELSEVAVAARICVNGKLVGKLWKRPWRLEITDGLREGENVLEIIVGNLLINCVLNPAGDPQPYPDEVINGWPYFSETINQIRRRRIGYEKERAAVQKPVDSGLTGMVRIVLDHMILIKSEGNR